MFVCMAAALLSLYLAVEQDLSTWPGGMREAIKPDLAGKRKAHVS